MHLARHCATNKSDKQGRTSLDGPDVSGEVRVDGEPFRTAARRIAACKPRAGMLPFREEATMPTATGTFEITGMHEDPWHQEEGGPRLTRAGGTQRFSGE